MRSIIFDRFRDPDLVRKICDEIKKNASNINLMEVCGTHTMAIGRYGLRQILPDEINLISGPGCPVCVTPTSVIDSLLDLKEVTIATFGDLLRVPGSKGTLEMARGRGVDVQVVYSPLDALKLAEKREVVFAGIGFETTSPAVGSTIIEAARREVKGFSVLSAFKLIPPALDALLASEDTRIEGFILPGHVSTIIGSRPYDFIATRYGIGGIIAGFEPVDILEAVNELLIQKREKRSEIKIGYRRCVCSEGNVRAKEILNQVFEPTDSLWRGLGWIKNSGLRIREDFEPFDATKKYDIHPPEIEDDPRCQCGGVLKGIIRPNQCPLFARICNPKNPIGPCMVSSEGSCAAYYYYER
ncbi:MAG TPA: hydrogenase formation protein HypD [bacterium (Candidatus Stahlbacteria)]|nr:hydrogenase formation protein HypD [Candidatus Stahlbacteria bacterium]